MGYLYLCSIIENIRMLAFIVGFTQRAGQAVTACGAGRAQAPASKQEPACGAAR